MSKLYYRQYAVIVTLVAVMLANDVLSAADDRQWPFPVLQNDKVGLFENSSTIGIYNARSGVLFEKSTGLPNVYRVNTEGERQLITLNHVRKLPLWSAVLFCRDTQKNINVTTNDITLISYHGFKDGEKASITVDFKCSKLAIDFTLRVEIDAERGGLWWEMDVDNRNRDLSVWELSYPSLLVRCPDGDRETTHVLIPYRRGRWWDFGFKVSYPYPGAGARYQFMAQYRDADSDAFYIAAEDGLGYRKIFRSEGYSGLRATLFSITHIPVNRYLPGTGYTAPYKVVTRSYRGDWWHAARIYRHWWKKQIWASKGPVSTRTDVPEWLKKSAVIMRFSTKTPARTVENNLKGMRNLLPLLQGRPALGTWYIYGQSRVAYEDWVKTPAVPSYQDSGMGRVLPCKNGVQEALKELARNNIHMQAYIQSLIYDQSYGDTPDIERMSQAVCRDINGKPSFYSKSIKAWEMDRHAPRWQERIINLVEDALDQGFSGIYLDSFGKGSEEPLVAERGVLGGGNYGIEGQREMAYRVRTIMKQHNPQAVMGGEAQTEAFTDLMDYSLCALDTWDHFVPVQRTVYGDYLIFHGRVFRDKVDVENGYYRLLFARQFLEGIIFGRFFCSGGNNGFYLLKPEQAVAREYVETLLAYSEVGREYMRMGEYLHPLDFEPVPPLIDFKEGVASKFVKYPALCSTVARSHRDGSIGIAIVNLTGKDIDASFEVNPAWCLSGNKDAKSVDLLEMDQTGRKKKIMEINGLRKISRHFGPYDVQLLVLE